MERLSVFVRHQILFPLAIEVTGVAPLQTVPRSCYANWEGVTSTPWTWIHTNLFCPLLIHRTIRLVFYRLVLSAFAGYRSDSLLLISREFRERGPMPRVGDTPTRSNVRSVRFRDIERG
jgi:hypothetical protein